MMLFPSSRVILSLCDYSGSWSQPYRAAGYDVRQIDLAHGQDLRTLPFPGPVHGILAAPPCDRFCNPAARLRPTSDALVEAVSPVEVSGTRDRWMTSALLDRLSIADACLRLVVLCQPQWWVLENSTGRLKDWYGPPVAVFNPWEYAGWAKDPEPERYRKRTCLWGSFRMPEKRPRPPDPYPEGSVPGRRDRTSRMSSSWKRERAKTPSGFARAFFESNP
jgi:hypothetical protein